MYLNVRVLKTNHYLGETFVVPLPRLKDTALRFSTAVDSLLGGIQASPSKPLLSFWKNGQLTAMTAKSFNKMLRQVLLAAKVPCSKILTHSFRKCGATYAVRAGVPSKNPKAQGNWRITCYTRYIMRDDELWNELATALEGS